MTEQDEQTSQEEPRRQEQAASSAQAAQSVREDERGTEKETQAGGEHTTSGIRQGNSGEAGRGGRTESDPPGLQPPAQATAERPSEPGSREEQAPLFASEDVVRFRQRWETLQAGFIDQPRDMVEQADDLVSELMNQLTAGFNYKRSNLEAQWEHGDEVSTEELRVALTRYRSFFNRLLSA
jgi:hypothetical protein